MKKHPTWTKVAPLAVGIAMLLAACGGGGEGDAGMSQARADLQGRGRPAHAGNQGQAVSELAQDLTQRGVGIDRARLAHLIEVARDKVRAEPAQAQANMVSLNFSNPGNWFRRVHSSSAAQATPDAGGLIRSTDRRQRATAGQLAVWGFGQEPARQSDLHWNGAAWVPCDLQQSTTGTVLDADGNSQYSYCDGYERGTSNRTFYDVAGRTMLEVYDTVRAGGATNLFIANAPAVLGSATFPEGSRVVTQVNTPSQAAIAYYPGVGSAVRNARPDVAAGDPGVCPTILGTTPIVTYTSYATTLESMVAGNRGTPCIYGRHVDAAGRDSGPRNEWWSNSTVSLGLVGNNPPPAPPGYYTGNTQLRVAFADGNVARYYACQHRYDGSTRNCDGIGTGSYTIETLGDARIMRLQNLPAQVQQGLPYERIFVQRAGKVWLGYRNGLVPTSTARLNLAGLNALATQLGIPTIDPQAPLATTPASFQGQWVLGVAGTLDEGDTLGVNAFPAPGGVTAMAAVCIEDRTYLQLECGFESLDADGNFVLNTPNDRIVGRFSMVEGTASGTLQAPPGSPYPDEPMQGVRR